MAADRGTRRVLVGLAFALATWAATIGSVVCPASAAAPAVQLPTDEAAHRVANEWWYFSGFLSGRDAGGALHKYGFEYVTFQFMGGSPIPLFVGNAAVTDLTRGSFQYAARRDLNRRPSATGGFALHTSEWTMSGASGHSRLNAGTTDYRLQIALDAKHGPTMHGVDGGIDFGPFGTSKYYSWTSMQASGTVLDHGVSIPVTGTAWMDHQWGTFNFASGGGWDWFSLTVGRGDQYMLYFLRDRAGTIVRTIGTKIKADGTSQSLAGVQLKTLSSWTSPRTGTSYGSKWTITLPSGSLTVTPMLQNQELALKSVQGVDYWEGASSVSGTLDGAPVTGSGYTEINPPNHFLRFG